jgi:hypothetical protein
MKEFSGLDAKPFDNRPLLEKKKMPNSWLTPETIFDVSNISHENGEIDPELLAVERYTYASVIIEEIWKQARESSALEHDETAGLIPLGEGFWQKFADQSISILEKIRDSYYAKVERTLKEDSENLTFGDLATMRHMYLSKLDTGKLGQVSFDDFVVIYTRLARVVDELGGVDMTREQFEGALDHDSFRNMMLEMMMNSREAGVRMALFIDKGNTYADLEDTAGSFDSRHFVAASDSESGSFYITPNQETVGKAKLYIMELFRKKQAEGSAPSVFRCPVIYTGLFQEMCDWMKCEFKHHYLDQRY